MAVGSIVWKIILDIIVLACVGIPLLLLQLFGVPYMRGYFQDDLSLRLPYKEQSISEGLLAGIGFAVVVAMIIIVEFVRDKKGKGCGEKYLCGGLVPGWLWDSYTSIGVFTFGAACQQMTVNLAKFVIGRLRPHFYDVCMPLPRVGSNLNSLGYIQDFTCQTGTAAQHTEMRLSFPSAHSSFAMYSAIFFIMYVQVKGKWRGSKLLRHAVQFAIMMGAWYVGLSRVVDHMHHWGDVAAGFAVGAVYGLVVFVYVLKPNKLVSRVSWVPAPPEIPRPVLGR